MCESGFSFKDTKLFSFFKAGPFRDDGKIVNGKEMVELTKTASKCNPKFLCRIGSWLEVQSIYSTEKLSTVGIE